MLALFLIPVAATIYVAFAAAFLVSPYAGGSVLTKVVVFFGTCSLAGIYVAPHLQQQFAAAFAGLAKSAPFEKGLSPRSLVEGCNMTGDSHR